MGKYRIRGYESHISSRTTRERTVFANSTIEAIGVMQAKGWRVTQVYLEVASLDYSESTPTGSVGSPRGKLKIND